MQREYVTNSEQETWEIGCMLGRELQGGSVIFFAGGLGAGKTAFTRGLAAGLDITAWVSSPTFAIVNEYEGGRLPLFHFDWYRLGGEDELFDIGWEEYLSRGGVCAVEWSERAPLAFNGQEITVQLCHGKHETQRIIRIIN